MNIKPSMSKRVIRIATGLALVSVVAMIAAALLMGGAGGATAFNAGSSDSAAMHIPAQYTEQCSNGIALLYPERNPGLLSDCATLLAAKDTLEGDGDRRLNWSANSLIHSWEGVSVDISDDNATYRVLSLGLGGLAGTLPPELGNLGSLRSLWIGGNQSTGQLTGTLPPELGNLANLRQLYFHGNRLTGEIPSELGNLANLTTLWLDSNRLTGEIPSEL